ncbi:carboxylate-amine ligase [Agromyces salentinus]|uniref:Putative glutamate--cysteine ligase 2 n=1 Tax=Agromyces salentinus TaxID=269421 RepID=A0ABN2MFZ8_9MICO|nr:YbdK family carboxylate-amine ligase [Agromyces salentinus]
MARFGVEEEFMLLDRHRLSPVARGAEAQEILERDPLLAPDIRCEFLAAQIEHATGIHDDLGTAGADLLRFRTELVEASRDLDVVPVGTGTPFDAGPDVAIMPTERYLHIADDFGDLIVDHQVNGLHVHVEVTDPEARVHALNVTRVWLPVLMAATGNSPFWRGRDTGFASWRHLILRRQSTAGCPPEFVDATDYQERTQALVELGAVVDLPSIAWAARLSERFPTVELRVFDAQLTVDDALLAVALTRAIVTSASEQSVDRDAPTELLDGALWAAARTGMESRLPDPVAGGFRPAQEVLDHLVEVVRPALEDAGDLEFAMAGIERVRAHATGAERQRTEYRERGFIALRDWYEQKLGAGTASRARAGRGASRGTNATPAPAAEKEVRVEPPPVPPAAAKDLVTDILLG